MEKRDFLKTSLAAMAALLLPRKIQALDFYPTKENVEWAVLFGTWCGSARDASVWISEGMDGIADVFDVRENPDLSRYKHIVVGGAIRSGVVSPQLQKYITDHQSSISDKVRGLFVVCGNMRQPVTSQQYNSLIDNHLAKLTNSKNVPSKVFLGRITFGLMEKDVQQQMKSMPGMEEYDNLKRSDCLAFGREVLNSVAD